MRISKKVTDFIKLEDGNIGRKAAVVTGALLASTVLGAVLTSTAEAGWCHCNLAHQEWHLNSPSYPHSEHYDTPHVNEMHQCPPPVEC